MKAFKKKAEKDYRRKEALKKQVPKLQPLKVDKRSI
jgi:hypothetical protein